MSDTPLLQQLMDALRCLPGVGPKSAQRMAFHLLERDRNGATRLASLLSLSLEHLRRCNRCRTLTEHEICEVCADQGRDKSTLCVVENPADALAIEQSAGYRGDYFILLGNISPLDGIGPEELGLQQLESRLREGEVEEIILATNSTVEGEVTANYIHEMAQSLNIRSSRIAHGVPFGGELEYIDGQTLSHAFAGRTKI